MKALATILLTLTFACGAPPKPPVDNEGSDTTSTNCCCKTNPATSEDGKAVYATQSRMECSTQQGTCMGDGACRTSESTPTSAPSM